MNGRRIQLALLRNGDTLAFGGQRTLSFAGGRTEPNPFVFKVRLAAGPSVKQVLLHVHSVHTADLCAQVEGLAELGFASASEPAHGLAGSASARSDTPYSPSEVGRAATGAGLPGGQPCSPASGPLDASPLTAGQDLPRSLERLAQRGWRSGEPGAARTISQALLPSLFPELPGLGSAQATAPSSPLPAATQPDAEPDLAPLMPSLQGRAPLEPPAAALGLPAAQQRVRSGAAAPPASLGMPAVGQPGHAGARAAASLRVLAGEGARQGAGRQAAPERAAAQPASPAGSSDASLLNSEVDGEAEFYGLTPRLGRPAVQAAEQGAAPEVDEFWAGRQRLRQHTQQRILLDQQLQSQQVRRQRASRSRAQGAVSTIGDADELGAAAAALPAGAGLSPGGHSRPAQPAAALGGSEEVRRRFTWQDTEALDAPGGSARLLLGAPAQPARQSSAPGAELPGVAAARQDLMQRVSSQQLPQQATATAARALRQGPGTHGPAAWGGAGEPDAAAAGIGAGAGRATQPRGAPAQRAGRDAAPGAEPGAAAAALNRGLDRELLRRMHDADADAQAVIDATKALRAAAAAERTAGASAQPTAVPRARLLPASLRTRRLPTTQRTPGRRMRRAAPEAEPQAVIDLTLVRAPGASVLAGSPAAKLLMSKQGCSLPAIFVQVAFCG